MLQGFGMPGCFVLKGNCGSLSVCAAAEDPVKRTLLQLQKAFSVDGVTTPLGAADVEASRLWPDHFYTPIAKYMNNLIDRYRAELAEE